MKVTPKTPDVRVDLYEYKNEAFVTYSPSSYETSARVVEFPKVWREDGKQFSVTNCSYTHNGDREDKVTVRIPKVADYYVYFCDYTIERY